MAPAPGAQTMWRAWLGANLTHGLGLLAFALLLLAVAVHDSALVSDIPGIRPLSITVALTYVLIALRFWFLPAAVEELHDHRSTKRYAVAGSINAPSL